MNLFILDLMPVTAAQYNCDRHVIKIILEAVEMMGYAYDSGEFKPLLLLHSKGKHVNHPMSKWVRGSKQNFDWTLQHANALSDEYTFRYGKQHAYRTHLHWIEMNLPVGNLPNFGQTDWPRCFGEWRDIVGVTNDVVYDYRRYYMLAKRFAKWTKRLAPEWYR
jgi:hypothetical protein